MIDGQGDLFTQQLVPSGEALARVGMQQAADHSEPAWLAAAKQIVWDLASGGEPWTTDIVWYRLELLGHHTHEPRALGAVIRSASKKGFIAQQGYTPTTRREAHARPIPVWCGTGKRAA